MSDGMSKELTPQNGVDFSQLSRPLKQGWQLRGTILAGKILD